MTFLEICQKVREKVAISGAGPTTVVAQSGSLLRVINCVIEAWREIQSSQTEWTFMQRNGTLNLAAATQSYSLATLVAANARYGKMINGTLKYTDGARIDFVTFEDWELLNYDIGTQTGRPQKWTQDADQALLFYPIPTAIDAVRFRYNQLPQLLAANGDIPNCPEELHTTIVYRAAILYAALDEAPDLVRMFVPEYQTWMTRMENSQLPGVGFGPSKYRSPR
jgi:hypothetical protein